MDRTIEIIKLSVSALVGFLLGGFDAMLQTLLIFMALDFITGIIAAGFFRKSTKTENGAIETRAGLKGLI